MYEHQTDYSIDKLDLSHIILDEEIQPRHQLNQEVIAAYAEAMQAGAQFSPVKVLHDGANHWLVDGFHRYEAASLIKASTISAKVYPGTRRDAVLYSIGVNGSSHRLRRTNADKRRVVEQLLNDPEWRQWSNREIARRCGVSYETVRNLRTMLSVKVCQIENSTKDSQATTQRLFRRNGKVQAMNVSNIGKVNGCNPSTTTI